MIKKIGIAVICFMLLTGTAKADYSAAVQNIHDAAAKGSAEAQNALGGMYVKGLGVEKNNVEAVKWFRQAAAKGSAEAQNNLGVMYTQGPEVALEYVKTARK